ncbi:hypothetical protein Bbelb_024540 [Branchiostoma belcheri]|nr:hypothetical protein Bbelb_024540 [Branchiostoma belcheri]
MEHIVVTSIMHHFEVHDVLNDSQHGFRKGRSCETQLLDFAEELTTNLESGKQTDLLIMDFAKAFDRVNHSLLVHKLHRYGVGDSTLAWINNFLSDRRQAVVVDGHHSSFVRVLTGVPQGSVLGPCLFLAYINDLPNNLNTRARLFADDTAVYKVVVHPVQQDLLQQDLQSLEQRENKWDMTFHPEKCVYMPVTRSRKPLLYSYVLHGHTLEKVHKAKYLGITMSSDGSWDNHINNIVTKAKQVLGFLRRNLKISSIKIKERAYKTFVRPLLEYAATVWDPYTQKNISKLEAIQHRAARFVLHSYHNTSSVTNMLTRLGWKSLEDRRRLARVGILYKLHHGVVQCPTIAAKLIPPPPRQRRSHNQQFKLVSTRTQYRGGSFLPRSIRDWNHLQKETLEAATVEAFVSRAAAEQS